MAGVAQHSDFRVDFWGRLRRTSDFLFSVIYSPTDEVEQAAAVVRAVHTRITGVDDFTGEPYRADEPELLVWVANATVDSYLAAFRLYGNSRLTPEDADRYVYEMRTLGHLMGVDKSDLAQDATELHRYMHDMLPRLAASPAAKEGTRRLVLPDLPWKLRPLWTVPASAAVASLPSEYRNMYGLPWLGPLQPGIRISTTAYLQGLRLILPEHPAVVEARNRARRLAVA